MVNMKILFVCAGGMSTGLIVKKMEKWASENGKDLVVKATVLEAMNQSGRTMIVF